MKIDDIAQDQLDVVQLPSASGPPSPDGLLDTVLYAFRRGAAPEDQPALGFFTDTSVCIGCKACQVACKQWNLLPALDTGLSGQSYDNTLTLSAEEWRHVKFIELFEEAGLPPPPIKPAAAIDGFDIMALLAEPKAGQWLMMSDSCKHCVVAPCHLACPTGAIVHTEFANVFIQPDICNGCASCVAACPFGVITRSQSDGHSYKCTMCYDRLRDGLQPACARACPTWAINFGPIEDMRALARHRLEALHERGVEQATIYGDAPTGHYSALHNFYLLLAEPTTYGLPSPPVNPQIHLRGDYLRAAVGVIAALIAVTLVLLMLGG
ncbi:MAG: 4Fe-4S dicluster domain-containing protein [Anaerolineae bacterium]